MFPKNAVVKARKAFESLYDGTCSIIEYQEYTKPNKSTGHHEVKVLGGQPCRLSFSNISTTNQTDSANGVGQTIKVFLPPEIKVAPGSKLTITQNGVTTEYKNSGESAFYETHQEIILDLFERWA